MLAAIAPLARTPMDEKSGRAMSKYAKEIEKTLNSSIPWLKSARGSAHHRSKAVHKDLNPGELVVILDAGDRPDDPLFADSKIVKG